MTIGGVASIFRITNGAALSTNGDIDTLQNSTSRTNAEDFGPYNKFIVRNNSTAVILLRLDGSSTGDRTIRLNDGETAFTDAKEEIFFTYILVELSDATNTVAVGDIDATFIRSVSNG